MTTSHLIAAAALTVLVAGVGWLYHWFVLDARVWPLVGREWREARLTDLPGPARHSTVQAAAESEDRWAGEPYTGEILTEDQWEQLDPDTQAETLIAEWHAEESEAMTTTDTLRLLDDAELLLWDCRRQIERIRDIRHDYRLEMADLLSEYQADIDARSAA